MMGNHYMHLKVMSNPRIMLKIELSLNNLMLKIFWFLCMQIPLLIVAERTILRILFALTKILRLELYSMDVKFAFFHCHLKKSYPWNNQMGLQFIVMNVLCVNSRGVYMGLKQTLNATKSQHSFILSHRFIRSHIDHCCLHKQGRR